MKKKRVIVAQLNWGLGHATRCIPIIAELRKQGAEVIIASDGESLALLRKEYPQNRFMTLPSYNVRYPANKNMMWAMAKQMHRIIFGIVAEHWLINLHLFRYRNNDAERIDVIISDNRFGLFLNPLLHWWLGNRAITVFMTHQVNIRVPNPFLQKVVNFFNRQFIRFFSICWIPDFEHEPNLSGELSHGHFSTSFQKRLRYIGTLSRMQPLSDMPKKYPLAVILSGPEPQRTVMEELVKTQLFALPHLSPVLLVRGKPQGDENGWHEKNLHLYHYLTSRSLNEAICSSEVLLCRSGYSTLMDLQRTNSKAILVPTEGQTEQEYLAESLAEKGIFAMQNQNSLNITEALLYLDAYSGFQDPAIATKANELLEKNVKEILGS